MITTINDYVKKNLDITSTNELCKKLEVSASMISAYKDKENTRGFNTSLKLAIRIYKLDGIALHPFAKESLELEIKKDTK